MNTSRQYIRLNPRSDSDSHSDAVLQNDTLYIAGRIGHHPDSEHVPETLGEEAEILMDNVRDILAQVGMTCNDLVTVQVTSTDTNFWEPFNDIFRRYFTGPLPALGFVGTHAHRFGARFELQAIAVRS
jgi:2-iminobutanoate/2-iminopropanoate deaminase